MNYTNELMITELLSNIFRYLVSMGNLNNIYIHYTNTDFITIIK